MSSIDNTYEGCLERVKKIKIIALAGQRSYKKKPTK
jgi:hypothetical protein